MKPLTMGSAREQEIRDALVGTDPRDLDSADHAIKELLAELDATRALLNNKKVLKLPVSFKTLGDDITIREETVEGLACFDPSDGSILIDPNQPEMGKLICIIHEALHVGEVMLDKEIDHEFITAASFGVATILVAAGAVPALTLKDVIEFVRAEKGGERA